MSAPEPAESKVMPLSAAVGRFVRPGMSIHLAYGGGRPNAALAEVARQYAGKNPRFTISAHGFVSTQHVLLQLGLVGKLVVAYAGENYPAPRPSPILRRAVRSGAVKMENWSLWTLTARLVAGALGVPFLPVRSLAGSGMAKEHEGWDYSQTVGPGGTVSGVVAAYCPDLTLVQGAVADKDGNTILPPPYGEGAWGSFAAREGVIACVERIVDDAYIRRHNQLPMIPGHVVRAVCLAPLGSHPYGLQAPGLAGVGSYVEDGEFMSDFRRAAKTDETAAAWAEDWVTGLAGHNQYLGRLGADRVAGLARTAEPARSEPRTGPATPDEAMTLAAVRVLRDRVRTGGHDVVLAGIGYAHLAAWTAVGTLRRQGVDVQLAAELGMSGFVPGPGDPYLFASQNFPTCLQLTDVMSVLGRDVSGPATSAVGILGAGQIDSRGNINSTWSENGDFIVGSGGANDVASGADEVVAVVRHSADRLVQQVGYVTAPGDNVTAIVTSRAVLERRDDRFVATSWLGDLCREDAVAQIREHTGWDVEVDAGAGPEPPPDPDDLATLRGFDPQGVFLRPPKADSQQ